jgi:hypothetical protein
MEILLQLWKWDSDEEPKRHFSFISDAWVYHAESRNGADFMAIKGLDINIV